MSVWLDWPIRSLHSPPVIYVHLVPCPQIQLMISHPAPGVLHVDIGLRGHMKQQECTLAWHCICRSCSVKWILEACVLLELGTSRASNPPVNVPHPTSTRSSAGNIPFHDDSAGNRAFGLKD